MGTMDTHIMKEEQKRMMVDIIRVYKHHSAADAEYWGGLLVAIPGFSLYYYRTHLQLGERSIYRTNARAENKQMDKIMPVDWYIPNLTEEVRMEYLLDRRIYLVDGIVTEPILGVDVLFNRILCGGGQVYELRRRVDPPKKVLTAALLQKPNS